jgi:LysM repeat protein
MAAIELIKENIEYEQLLGENSADTVIKAEYLIPDTLPDVTEILMLDVKPSITKMESMQDKVYIEGQVEYNILYLAKEDAGLGVHNVNYTDKFSNYVDIQNAEHNLKCEAECNVEHMDCSIINERKISVGGVIRLKSAVYKDYQFEIIKDIATSSNIQMLKRPAEVDKIIGTAKGDLIAKSNMVISMDKPQIGVVLKCDIKIHKKEVKLMDDKVQVSAFALIEMLYRGQDTRDIIYMKDDVFLTKEIDVEGVNPSMEVFDDYNIDAMEFDIKEDDLGEKRRVDVEAFVSFGVKVMSKVQVDMIEDTYSPQLLMEMNKRDYMLNVMHGQGIKEAIVKENVELSPDLPRPSSVIMCNGSVSVTDKKLVEDKIVVEGIIKVDVLYKTDNEEANVSMVNEELPFSTAVEIPDSKIDMQCITKASLENIEASIEANTIAVKAVITIYGRVNYTVQKDFLVELSPIEGELPKKKASITLYAVQPGDTLWKIAKQYLTSIEELMKINSLEDAENLTVNQKLLIPGRAVI